MHTRPDTRLPGQLLAVLLATSTAAADAPVPRILSIDDYSRFSAPWSPRISRDGSNIAYVYEDRIFVVSANGGESRALTSAESKSWHPEWSRDARSLYFLSDRSGKAQVWQLPVRDFGEASPVTDFESGVSNMKISPDETRLLLELSDNDLAGEDNNAEPKPFVVTRRHFKKDAGDGYITAGQAKHLYLLDIETGALTQLTAGEFEEASSAWSPDGKSVVFLSNRDEPDASYSNDLWTVAADGNGGVRSPTRLSNDPDTKNSPAFSPDGKLIAYITAVDGVYGLQQIAVIPSSGGERRMLTASLDRWVSSFEFADNGEWIYFNYDDSGATHLARVRLRDARIEKLTDGDYAVSSFDVGGNGDVAFVASRQNATRDLYRHDGRRLSRLTNFNRRHADELVLGNRFLESFESRDGTVVEAFLTTPPGYEAGVAYPAILKIHGGPVGQFSWGFDFATQYLASRGFVVIEPNPRGSTGRGQEYISAIYRTWGITDYDDVIAAVDFAIEKGLADPERLAVTGYSYGGYMTNVVITHSARFKAAASGAGHSLIAANLGHDIYQKWYMWELGPPWEHRERYDVLSPLLRAGSVETPTIFLGGRIDWNVPILNAELFYQALAVRGIDTELVVYPDVHHGGWPEEFEKDYLERVVGWFERYIATEPVQMRGGAKN